MRRVIEFIVRVALLAFIWFSWWWVLNAQFSNVMNLTLIVAGVLLTFPLVWLGRKILDRHQTTGQAVWITTFVHFGLGFTFGIPIVLAVTTHRDWSGWLLPVPSEIGLALVIITGAASLTRNPMVLAALAFFLSLGIWFQSMLFVLWVLILFAPALLFFVKVFEERELEFRFGASYLEYKSRTPMLFPRRPRD